MDDQLKRRISDYVDKFYGAALHTSNQVTAKRIAETTARLTSKGMLISGYMVSQIAEIQGDHINTVVQARADALLDAYELYGAEIDDAILTDVTSVRRTLINHVASSKAGLPLGVPASELFPTLLDTNTGGIVNSISCQIEQRKVVPKIKRVDIDRCFEEMAIQEARLSISEDQSIRPKVGAVVVKDGRVVSKAHRGENPRRHAEYIALEDKLPGDLIAGATVYTTLEPCTTRNHPKIPCAQRLVDRKVARVVIGMLDPNPEIRGMGVQTLTDHGIETQFFPIDLQNQIAELNRDFIRVQKDRQKQGQRAHAMVSASSAQSEIRPIPKVTEILKHVGHTVEVFNRQKYGHGYLEGFWASGAVITECTPLWVVLEDPATKAKQSFPIENIEITFDFQKNRLQLTVNR